MNPVIALVRAHFSVIPVTEGDKKPHRILGKSHDLFARRSTEEEVKKWLAAGVKSWGLAGGPVSNNLVTLDFDEKNFQGLYNLWYARLSDDQKEIVKKCALNKTINNGKHLRYRTQTPQPTEKLSRRVIGEKIETTSEVRGEGAYALIPPSSGYSFIHGDLENLPEITDEEHESLIDVLRTFDEVFDEPPTQYEHKLKDSISGDRPGDRLNNQMPWEEILEPHGWVQEKENYWRRPGKKDGEGISATTGYDGKPMFYVFSTAAHPFKANTGYLKFHVFTLLNHDGDFKAAAKEAAEMFQPDWEEVFSDEVLKEKMSGKSAIKVAGDLLRAMPPEVWPIGLERFRVWNSFTEKPLKENILKRAWRTVEKTEKLKKDKEGKEEKEPEIRERIAKCPMPEKLVTFDDWNTAISTNFPDLHFASETALSVLAQFLIKDIVNPFALILVDVPSSGKTIAINFFDNIPELAYATDKFTPASFVSNSANVAKEDLAEIDLLPRIQYRMFLIRDFATLFSKREDDLNELLGILTRVLDGEGLVTDTGVHGQREYKGEYLFMLLGASTPISPRVMKVMGNLGSRLFFLTINSRNKSEAELAAQIADLSYKEKETRCRIATRDFLYTLWNSHPQGVDWNRKADDQKILAIIARCSKLLAHLRGVINVWQDDFNNSDYKYSTPLVEKPDRLNQLFYNLARGHALICGRTQLAVEDLRAVIELCIDGAPSSRASFFRKLIEHGGSMSTSEIEKELKCSKPTALKEMKILEILGVCSQQESKTEDNKVTLLEHFQWFLSDECKNLRGIKVVKGDQ